MQCFYTVCLYKVDLIYGRPTTDFDNIFNSEILQKIKDPNIIFRRTFYNISEDLVIFNLFFWGGGSFTFRHVNYCMMKYRVIFERFR